MQHEVINFVTAVLTMRIRIECGQQSGSTLYAHSQMQTASLTPELAPTQELRITQPFLCLGNRPSADPAHDQFVPDLI